MNEDRAMILCPAEWPRWPILPVVQRVTGQDGIIVALPYQLSRVYLDNMYALASRGNTIGEVLDGLEFKDYESVDALLADGWRVD